MDSAKLEYEMKKKKISILQMCEKLGISRSAFYRKCNGYSEFTLSEIQDILNVLDLDSPMDIFFNSKMS